MNVEMTTRIYKIDKILGRFFPSQINKISKFDLCGEISDFGIDQNFDGTFEALIYDKGQLSDIEINGWTFSCHIKGNYHMPGTYYSTSYEIECFDPDDYELKLYNTPYKVMFYEDNVLRNYMEMVSVYSQFENSDIATKFNYLSRTIDEGLYGGRGRDPMKIKYEDVLNMIKFFKNYYESLGEGDDVFLREKVKEIVNDALDSTREYFKY